METKAHIGKLGEDLACDYLIRNGYRIIDRNYRLKIGEIDIIAMGRDKTLVFIEVKTMTESGDPTTRLPASPELRRGEPDSQARPNDQNRPVGRVAGLVPEDNLTGAKLKKLSRTCELFVGKNPELVNEKKGWRIDLVAISLNSNSQPRFTHYENIFKS